MLIEKEELPLVAMEFMNNTHTEDLEIINELFELVLKYEKEASIENEARLNSKYKEWLDHTIEHFKAEEIMMQEKNFPPYPMHKAEHDNALKTIEKLFEKWLQTKDIQILKQYFIETLPGWLVGHIKTMDTVTAMFFKTGLSPCGGKKL